MVYDIPSANLGLHVYLQQIFVGKNILSHFQFTRSSAANSDLQVYLQHIQASKDYYSIFWFSNKSAVTSNLQSSATSGLQGLLQKIMVYKGSSAVVKPLMQCCGTLRCNLELSSGWSNGKKREKANPT